MPQMKDLVKIYEEIIKYVEGNQNFIMTGDWNAVIGTLREGRVVGDYGLRGRNERENRLVEFCM